MRFLLISASVMVAFGLSACARDQMQMMEKPEISSNSVALQLDENARAVILRDVRPAIRNAVKNGPELNSQAAEITELSSVSAGGHIYACGKVLVPNVVLGTEETLSFSGELVQKVMFVRDYIGGDSSQEAFVKRACAKRGMKLSG